MLTGNKKSDPTSEERLQEIMKELQDCRRNLEGIRDELFTDTYKKVRAELNTSISGIRRACKELDEVKPMEGQIDIFDLMR